MLKLTSLMRCLALAFICATLWAAPYAKADTQICTINGTQSCTAEQIATNPQCACIVTNGAVLGRSATRPPNANGANVYLSAGVLANQLVVPIDAWGVCRFVNNAGGNDFPPGINPPVAAPKSARTPSRRYLAAGQADPALSVGAVAAATGAYFVPFSTQADWISFITANSNPLRAIYAVPCARPANVNTGVTTDETSNNFPAVPVTVDVPSYGYPTIPGRSATNPPSSYTTTKTYNHTRQDCNAVNQCNTQTWTQVITIGCTAVVDTANNVPTSDAGRWSCTVTNNNNPRPPITPPPAPSCNGQSSGSTYFVFDTTISQQVACESGIGSRQFLQDQERQVQCSNGTETATGVTRLVNPRYVGECSTEPTCIFRDNNQDTVRKQSECCIVPGALQICGSRPSNVPATLAANAFYTLTGGFNRQETYRCAQVATANNNQAVFSFVSTTQAGLCTAQACGSQPSGSVYWKNINNSSSQSAASATQCPAGGTVTTTFTNQSEYQCFNGTETATGNTRQVNLVNQYQCNPLSCNGQPSGTTYWLPAGNVTQLVEATLEQCPAGFGGTVDRITTYQRQYACTDGSQTETGGLAAVSVSYSNLNCFTPPPVSDGGGGSGGGGPGGE